MALINNLNEGTTGKQSIHGETDNNYFIVLDSNGDKYLQIDTYGSPDRQMPGKVSQSLQFSKQALEELKIILEKHF